MVGVGNTTLDMRTLKPKTSRIVVWKGLLLDEYLVQVKVEFFFLVNNNRPNDPTLIQILQDRTTEMTNVGFFIAAIITIEMKLSNRKKPKPKTSN